MALLAAALVLPPLAAGASPSDPAQWPEVAGVDPELSATPHTIRFSGSDRYQTNEALALGLRGKGDFPFDTSDRTSGGAVGLASANDWWGAATCPRSIIVVAGDTFADALAAGSLSDPSDRSAQPRVRRVATADPEFDPVGQLDRVDTAAAPVVVTTSARAGATSLSAGARATAQDLARGGCTTAREAIIVGGDGAVPPGVGAELVGLGYDEVFRVGGADRYETAAAVAVALGTGTPTGTRCADESVVDGAARTGWYGNAVVEYRPNDHSCYLLARSVVLADGGTGADALAAGWWTSAWQVPVLLTAPDGSLPPSTRAALSSLDIDTVIVLGGRNRIPDSSKTQAGALASATTGRISGTTRLGTSIAMAKQFGGWYPGVGASFADDLLCLTGSAGDGDTSTGWPDALAAGPWCARLGAARGGSPARALPPVTAIAAATASAGRRRPSHDAVPILLVPTGTPALPGELEAFLSQAFAPSSEWCSAEEQSPSCLGPGFGVIVGGPQAVPEAVADAVTDLVSGGHGGDRGERSPRAGSFATRLDLSPSFAATSPGSAQACFLPGAVRSTRWLSVTADAARRTFLRQVDLLRTGGYGTDGRSAPTCIVLGAPPSASVAAVSLSGRVGAVQTFDTGSARYLDTTAAVVQAEVGPVSGPWSFAGAPQRPVDVRRGVLRRAVLSATLDLTLRLDGGAVDRAVATGAFRLTTADGRLDGQVQAVATRIAGVWRIRGMAAVTGLNDVPELRGGFTADLEVGADGDAQVTWAVDGIPSSG